MNVNEDGTVVVITGHPDIGGSRASTANIVAEVLGIDYRKVSVLIGDTSVIGFSNLTGGSRVTYASAMVVTQSTENVIGQLKARAAKIWKIDPEAVVWENGEARPAGDNAGKFEPTTLGQLAAQANATGGPIGAGTQLNTTGAEGASPRTSVTSRSILNSASCGCCATPRSRMLVAPSIPATSKARCRVAQRKASAGP